jgi:protein phosphatase
LQRVAAFLYALYEHIEGQTLRQWILGHPRPPLDEVRRVVGELAHALRAMQRLQMVHRDLKPENVMIDCEGRARIVDLGSVHVAGFDEIAMAIRRDVPEGSASYLAPECLAGEPATHISDLFSLGVIAFEMLTGEVPYPTPANPRDPASYRSLEYRSASAANAAIPAWLDLTLQKAVARRPEWRYPSRSKFLTDLSAPNRAMVRRSQSAPLIERNPVRFWQLVSGTLALLLIWSALV